MRIAHLLTSMSRIGGVETNTVRDLTAHQSRIPGNEVAVFAIEDAFCADDAAIWGDLPVTACRMKGAVGFRKTPQLKTAVLAFDPDIVHVHGFNDAMTKTGAAVLKESGARFIITLHGALNEGSRRPAALQMFEDRAARTAGCLHALGTGEAKAIRAAGFQNSICVIPHGVAEPPQHIEQMERPWSLVRESERTLLFLGGLRPDRGLEPLIDGWAQFLRQGGHELNWRFQIVGWSPDNYVESLRARTIERSLGYSVSFPGPLFGDLRWAAYRHADAFILPSMNEGLSVAVLEAWACGLPVVMSPQCNLPDGFNAGAALETQPDADSICEAIGRITTMSDAECSEMGAKGMELSRSRYNWPKAVADLGDVYQWMCNRAPQPPTIVDDNDPMMLDIVA